MKKPPYDYVNKEYPTIRQYLPNFYGVSSVRSSHGDDTPSAVRRRDEANAVITVLIGPSDCKHSDMIELLDATRQGPPESPTDGARMRWPTREPKNREKAFQNLLSSVLAFGHRLVDDTRKGEEQFDEGEWETYAKNDIAEVIRIERNALDDIDTFYSEAITKLADGQGLVAQLFNFVWRSGARLAAVFLRIYARITLNLRVDDPTSSTDRHRLAVRLFLQNVARIHRKSRSGSGPDGSSKYVVIWMDRARGWNENAAKESPIFDALVSYLWRDDYRREIGFNGAFHLIISGGGDTRYILDTLGVEPRGGDRRIRYWDPGPRPLEEAEEVLKEHLREYFNKLKDEYLKKEEKFVEYCSGCCRSEHKLSESTVHAIAQTVRGVVAPVVEELPAVKQLREYISGKPLENLLHESWQESKYLYWGQIDLIYLVASESITWFFQYYWRKACRDACKEECKTMDGIECKDSVLDKNYGPSAESLEEPKIPDLIIQQLGPIWEFEANSIMVDLEQVGCTDVAIAVAQAVDKIERKAKTRDDKLVIISTDELRRTVKRALDDEAATRNCRGDRKDGAQSTTRNIDEVIALLLAKGMLLPVFGEPYHGIFESGEFGGDGGDVPTYRFLGQHFHSDNLLVHKKLLELGKGADAPVDAPTSRKFVRPSKK